MSQTIAENLALLRRHIRTLEERAEAAERDVEELTTANQTLAHMYLSRVGRYNRLVAQMGLVVMCRVQLDGPLTEESSC